MELLCPREGCKKNKILFMKRGSRKRKNASFDRRKGRKREILYKEDRSVKKATKGAQGKGAQGKERKGKERKGKERKGRSARERSARSGAFRRKRSGRKERNHLQKIENVHENFKTHGWV